MVLDSEVANVKTYFERNHIKLCDCWLENCVEWLRENNTNYSQKEMHMKIYEQWLLLDLRDVDIPVLPSNINSMQKMVLSDVYSLQLMYVVDISKPKYLQIQKTRNSTALEHNDYENNNTNNQKRMLQLTLTDGVQEVKAIEYNIIKCLHKNLTPGMKIQILGPVNVRKGQILLSNSCIKLLGGEVEELLISNASENILAAALNLPINPKPLKLEENIENFNNNRTEEQHSNITQNKKLKVGRNLDQINTLQNLQIGKQSDTKIETIDLEEEFRIDQEFENMIEIENEFLNKRRKISRSPEMFDDTEFDEAVFEKIDLALEKNNKNLKQIALPEISKPECSSKTNLNKMLENEFDLIDDKLFADIKLFENTNKISKKEYISIKELKDTYLTKNNVTYKIKAKFKEVVEKLTVIEEMWYLKVRMEDDSGCIDVIMHNDVIKEFVGYSSQDMMKLKADIVNKDSEAIEKISKALGIFRDKLVQIDCIMELEYKQNTSSFIIIKLFGK